MKNIKEKINKFLDKIFPPYQKCLVCENDITVDNKFGMCEDCLEHLPYNYGKYCLKCGCEINDLSDICATCFSNPPEFTFARAPFVYGGKIRKAVNNFKFSNARYMFKPLSEFMITCYKVNKWDCDVIIPMPLSEKRLKERGYNQAEELAKPISAALNLPILTNVAYRVKNTKPQSGLTLEDRMENMKDVFEIRNKELIKDKKILLIDDVLTTGATINSLAAELNKAKPKGIYVLTLAHTSVLHKSKDEEIYDY